MKIKIIKIGREIFFRSSWVTVFMLLCFALYENNNKNFNQDYQLLSSKYSQLEKEKTEAVAINKKLLLRINSQSDPAWLELVLIKNLGLIPENQKKIIFIKNNES